LTFVITRLCRDCVVGGCVEHCPVDAIVEHRPAEGVSDLPHQLFIDPVECIDCWCCVSARPFEAIYPEHDVPEPFQEDIAINARAAGRPEGFHVPTARLSRGATPDDVAANKLRWGLGAAWSRQ